MERIIQGKKLAVTASYAPRIDARTLEPARALAAETLKWGKTVRNSAKLAC